MRALLFVVAVSLIGCASPKTPEVKRVVDTVFVPVPSHMVCDTAYVTVNVRDTIYMGSDSMAQHLTAATIRLNSIKMYVNICNRNPKQDKFLRGWINRRLRQ